MQLVEWFLKLVSVEFAAYDGLHHQYGSCPSKWNIAVWPPTISIGCFVFYQLSMDEPEEFYNQQTFNMSRASIVQHIVKLATKAVGNSYHSAVESGFTDRKTDLMTRVSFKYGCSRGVFGTPFFFVNGFALPTAGPTLDYSQWRGLIDPLITKHEEGEERIHFV
ncbi:hypothetical protein HYC85_020762 [Camellia sinensis]|uniref:Thioredoxin-like fold domain-containing protein n=1 Tax=Camellia sinensis TaxID=4442 RepID=A0A7J7GR07_CAMSI|nr:hypothetical protein HYC85_020762 [Camellia sinensis]